MAPPGPSVGQHLFTPVSHPELRRLGRKAVQTFIRERERYMLKIDDANASGANVSAVSIKASIDTDLLLSLIDFDEFPGVSKFEELKEETLEEWLEEQNVLKLEAISLPDLEAAIKCTVKMNIHEPDPAMRIKAVFLDYRTLLRTKKWESLIESNPKIAVGHICGLIRPTALKQKIENDLALSHHALRKDWKGFYKHVVQKAILCDEFVRVQECASSDDKQFHNASQKGSRQQGRAADSRNQNASGANKDTQKANRTPSAASNRDTSTPNTSNNTQKKPAGSSSTQASQGKDELPFCLNTKECSGMRHLLKDCLKTSADEKKEIWRKIREEKTAKGRLNVLTTKIGPKQGSGRYRGLLADTVPVVVNGDYGADHSAMCEFHIQACSEAGIFVQLLTLERPISMELALNPTKTEEVREYSTNRKARISTTLETSSGPLRFRNVEYLVFKEHMPEVLLSRPVLMSIGFNLDEHLSEVRDRYHDADFSHIGFNPGTPSVGQSAVSGRLSRLLLKQDNQTDHTLPVDESEEYNPHSEEPPLLSDDSADELDQDSSRLICSDEDNMADDENYGGDENVEETSEAIKEMIQDAIDNGLPHEFHDQFKKIVWHYADIFRTKLGSDPPAKLPPMVIRLKKDSVPVRVKVRRYPPLQASFLRGKIEELLRLGLIRKNNSSEWACAPLIVPKAGPEGFRFTVDLRPINNQTVPHAWPMPNLETATAELAGDTCYASIDLCHGYWQLGLAEESQEYHSFITPTGVYTPTRVMHGATNATSFFQSSVREVTTDLHQRLLQWIDDLLFHCKTAKELVDTLEFFFRVCRRVGLKLHAKKCRLFLKVVKWCGRIISEEGVKLDPSRLQALLNMNPPNTGAELQQFLCAANWMRTVIPEFTKLTAVLADILEEVYARAGKRTRQSVSKVKVSLKDTSWSCTHVEAFEKIKLALEQSVTLAHPDPEKLLCLFTDASETHWSGVLTQIPASEVNEEIQNQGHEPLSFLSGTFKGSSSRWSTPEKEAFAIVECVTRLDYFLLGANGFHLFTDHKNLVFIFNPMSSNLNLSRHVASKIERWAMKLTAFRYTIVHIPGDDNC